MLPPLLALSSWQAQGSSNLGPTPNTCFWSLGHTLQLSTHTQISIVGSAFCRPLDSGMPMTYSRPAEECLIHAQLESRTEVIH